MIIYFLLVQVFPFIKKFYRRPFVSKRVETFFVKLMEDAIEMRKQEKFEREDFLNYIMQLQKKKNLSSLEMAAHTITFMLDGYETSSIAIAHVISIEYS